MYGVEMVKNSSAKVIFFSLCTNGRSEYFMLSTPFELGFGINR